MIAAHTVFVTDTGTVVFAADELSEAGVRYGRRHLRHRLYPKVNAAILEDFIKLASMDEWIAGGEGDLR